MKSWTLADDNAEWLSLTYGCIIRQTYVTYIQMTLRGPRRPCKLLHHPPVSHLWELSISLATCCHQKNIKPSLAAPDYFEKCNLSSHISSLLSFCSVLLCTLLWTKSKPTEANKIWSYLLFFSLKCAATQSSHGGFMLPRGKCNPAGTIHLISAARSVVWQFENGVLGKSTPTCHRKFCYRCQVSPCHCWQNVDLTFILFA